MGMRVYAIDLLGLGMSSKPAGFAYSMVGIPATRGGPRGEYTRPRARERTNLSMHRPYISTACWDWELMSFKPANLS